MEWPQHVRSLCIALGDAFHRSDVREFSKRLIRELCDEGSPAMTDWTFKQRASWCKTAGAYEAAFGKFTWPISAV